MGAGSTGIACEELGRNFIGVELDPEYYEIACRRLGVDAWDADELAAMADLV